MTTGTVKFFNEVRGFGFIAPDEGGPDVFVHVSALNRAGVSTLHDGQRVAFDVYTDAQSGRYAAMNIIPQ